MFELYFALQLDHTHGNERSTVLKVEFQYQNEKMQTKQNHYQNEDPKHVCLEAKTGSPLQIFIRPPSFSLSPIAS